MYSFINNELNLNNIKVYGFDYDASISQAKLFFFFSTYTIYIVHDSKLYRKLVVHDL